VQRNRGRKSKETGQDSTETIEVNTMRTIEMDNPELTFMLGYLEATKWADAIRQKSVSKELAFELIDIQDRAYNGGSHNIREEVEELIALNAEDWRAHMDAVNRHRNC